MSSMTSLWEVVGGAEKGGIIVRDGRDLGSAMRDARLATGSLVEEVERIDGRLKFRLVEGNGPNSGWVSLEFKGTDLLVKRRCQELLDECPSSSSTTCGTMGSAPEAQSACSKGGNLLALKAQETDGQVDRFSRLSVDSKSSTECPLSPSLSSHQSRACSAWSRAPPYESRRSTSKESNRHWEIPREYSPLQEKYSIVLDVDGHPIEIGRGSYGIVYQGCRKEDNLEVAIKVLQRSKKTSSSVVREVEVLRRVSDHHNIAKFLDVIDAESGAYSFVVTELYCGGDLWGYVKECGPLNEDRARQCLAQLLDAVEYIHRQGVVHQDLKRENVVLDDAGVLKVIDFGLSAICKLRTSRSSGKLKPVSLRGEKGTPGCMAPEVLEGKYQGLEADMWGVGVLLYEILIGLNPFQPNVGEDIQKSLIMSGQYNTTTPAFCQLSIEAQDLLARFFALDPRRRPTIQQVRESDWMSLHLAAPDTDGYRCPWATMPQRFDVIEEKKQEVKPEQDKHRRKLEATRSLAALATSYREGTINFPLVHRNFLEAARRSETVVGQQKETKIRQQNKTKSQPEARDVSHQKEPKVRQQAKSKAQPENRDISRDPNVQQRSRRKETKRTKDLILGF